MAKKSNNIYPLIESKDIGMSDEADVSITSNGVEGEVIVDAGLAVETDYETVEVGWNISHLCNLMNTGKVTFDILAQRGLVWNAKKDSLLIWSAICGVPIPNMYLNKTKDGLYRGIDGKQRSTALSNFVNNNLKLYASTPPVIKNGKIYKIARHSFKDLPVELQNDILRRKLDIRAFDNITPNQELTFFNLINSGKPVTSVELARTGVKSRSVFVSLANHPAIVAAVKDKARKKLAHEDVVEQIWYICYNENPSLLTKDTSKVLAAEEITGDQERELLTAFDYMNALYVEAQKEKNIFRKLQGKTHIVSIGYMAYVASKRGMSIQDFVDRAMYLFSAEGRTATISEEYNYACRVETAKAVQVKKRMDEVVRILDLDEVPSRIKNNDDENKSESANDVE